MTVSGAGDRRLTTSICTSGLPPEYDLVVKAIVVIVLLNPTICARRYTLVSRGSRDERETAPGRDDRRLPGVVPDRRILYKNSPFDAGLGDILADNAFIITAAIGTTFVILSAASISRSVR